MNDLYTFTIFPIELIYKYIYLALFSLINDYGIALLALSLLNYFLLMPLNKLVRGISETESQMQQILAPQLQKINESSRAEQRHQRIQNLYRRYSYHPIFALRNVFPLLVQLPFLMAVYFMVSSLADLNGVGFLFISNLAQPDGILWGINIMPLLMTLVSLFNACFIVQLSKPQKKQAIAVALIFLALLYTAPSALLVYWTMNNVLILIFGLIAKTAPAKSVVRALSATKENLFPSLLESSGLFLTLSFCVPLCFTVSLNAHMFHDLQISRLFIFFIMSIFCCLTLGCLVDKLIKLCSHYYISIRLPFHISIKNATAGNSWSKLYIKDSFYMLIALISTYYMTMLCILFNHYINDAILRNFSRITLLTLLFLIARKYSFKMINIAMLAMLIFIGIQFSNNQEDSASGEELIQTSFNAFPLDEKLHNKPNIYVALLESYMSSKTLRQTYAHDNSIFENTLTQKGFHVYDHVYSHTSFTQGAMLNLFMMQANVSVFFKGLGDVSPIAHNLFGGSRDNLLYYYLKKNNYNISSYYNHQDGYYNTIGELLDHTIKEPDLSLITMLQGIAPVLCHKLHIFGMYPSNGLDDVYAPAIKNIQTVKELDQPAFLFIKPTNDLHYKEGWDDVPSTYKQWISSGIYQKGVDKMNEELLHFISEIEKNDSNAVIVLIGDHAHRYHVAACHVNPKPHMSSEELIEDKFSVFLAIKLPPTAKGQITDDSPFIYADLFKHIFAALDDNPVFLEHKSEDISLEQNALIARRGNKIFKDGEKSEPPNKK